MKGARILIVFLTIVVVALLLVYFFVPFNVTDLSNVYKSSEPKNYDFNLVNVSSNMQFYENMRYPSSRISYKIYDECTLQKQNDMERAFEIISNLTLVEFYPAVYGEEISVTCSNQEVYSEGYFVGGEGGVTNVTVVRDFNVILAGKVLLIRDSDCPLPNIAIHELLHAMGFAHSPNPNNIMYETSSCSQTIGDDIPKFINEIYSVPTNYDLSFEDVSVSVHGAYLDTTFNVRNNGFELSPYTNVLIYADDKEIKNIELVPLDIGFGRKITLENLLTKNINVDEVKFVIESSGDELNSDDNVVIVSAN